MEINSTPSPEGAPDDTIEVESIYWQPYTDENRPADKSKCLYMIFTEMEGIYDAADAHFIPDMSRVPNSHIAIFRQLEDAGCTGEESSGENPEIEGKHSTKEASEEV